MTSFYWASGLLYEPDDVVQPGSWGRTVLGAGTAHSAFQQEVIFELLREQHFGHLPSRLSSLMVARTYEDAVTVWQHPDGRRHVYELELADSATDVSTVLDARCIDAWGNKMHSMAQVRTQVAMYWQGHTNPLGIDPAWEVLVPGPMRVVRRIVV